MLFTEHSNMVIPHSFLNFFWLVCTVLLTSSFWATMLTSPMWLAWCLQLLYKSRYIYIAISFGKSHSMLAIYEAYFHFRCAKFIPLFCCSIISCSVFQQLFCCCIVYQAIGHFSRSLEVEGRLSYMLDPLTFPYGQ